MASQQHVLCRTIHEVGNVVALHGHGMRTVCIFGKTHQIRNPLKPPTTSEKQGNVAIQTSIKFCSLKLCTEALHPVRSLNG